ncbi:hypothetical protein GCM10023172_17530 [Hymenobacter ginsengisoli]|uniref:histidine kinase n=1 Tax=Hymenobacter ginsengisoli TaxID=1051626 RepID=A0ABP8QBN0_9BACT|nr:MULTISPECIES: PAS domain-containing protein [unclassified Hymenobacter]MBO2030704.1 PAS domain-containing protein [Hymenobacter sp. BT559]
METALNAQPAAASLGALLAADELLDALPWGVLVVDAQGVVRRINHQAAHWCGVPPAALLGHPLAQAELLPEVRETLLQLLEPDQVAPREVWLPQQARWITLSATAHPAGWVLYGQDITPQKRREQQYQTLATNTPDVLTRWGTDLRLRYANAAFATETGQPLSALLGRTFDQMHVPADVAGPYMAALQRAFATGQPQEHYHALPTPRGTAYYYARLVPELRNGELDTVLSIARDITELRQSQAEALRLRDVLTQHATDKYHALFYTMNQGFCLLQILFDESGEHAVDFKYLEVNPVFAQQSGMPADTLGKYVREVMPDLDTFWFETYGQVARTGNTVRVEHHVPQLGRWFDVHAFRVGAPADHQVAVLFNDITARKQTEAQLRRAAEADTFRLRLADALGPLADPVAIQEAVTHMTREYFGTDRCYYCELINDEAVIRRDAAAEGLPSVAGSYSVTDFILLKAVLQAGQAFSVRDVRHDASVDEGMRQLCLQLQLIAYLDVPVIKNKQPVGVLVLAHREPREWTAAEAALATEVAERTWAAVERARTEEALRASEQRQRALISNLPGAAVFIVGRDLRYQLAEGEALRQIGLAPAAFQDRHVRDLAPPEQWPTYRIMYEGGLAGQAFVHEHEQSGHHFLTRGVPLRDAAGGVDGVLAVSYDLTARKQAEEALRLSEERLQLALQAGQMGSFEWTSVGNRLGLSPMSEEVLGLLPGTTSSTSDEVFELLHPDDRTRHQALFEQAGRLAQDYHSRYRIVRPRDGQVRWIEERGQGSPDPATNSTRLRGVHWDVTEQVAAQQQLAKLSTRLEQRVARRTQELQASRDLLQSVLDTSLISMSVLNAVRDDAGQVQDFRLALVNKELERQTGRTDLVGKLYAQEYPGIRQVGIFDLMLRALATGEPQSMEYFYEYEGFNKWFACQFVKMGDGLVATNLDITERKIADQERTRNLHLLEQAEAVAGLGSWDYDLLTQQIRWSDGMYRLFDLPVGQPVEAAAYTRFVVEEDRLRAEQMLSWLTTGSGSFEATLRLRINGQVKTLRIKAVVLRDEASQPVRVLGVDLDISELQRLETDNLRLRLTQQQALFEAVQAAQETERKRMAESLHNGIGQILYATKLRFDRLHAPLLGTAPTLAAARREADELLSEAIRQTRALSHELVPMTLKEFGLAAALQDISHKMSTPPLRLRSHVLLDDDAAPLAPSLQMALYRMAQELAQNIAKHARGATEASLELETMPGWVLLRAEDNGPGFAPGVAQSAGLGLRSIRDRVALLGGKLEIGSAPTGGAYVRIRIPLQAFPAHDTPVSR